MTPEDRLARLRTAMEQYYASWELYGWTFPIVTDSDRFLFDWLRGVNTFFDLDLSFGEFFEVTDHVLSYPREIQAVITMAMVYAAASQPELPIGQYCAQRVFECLPLFSRDPLRFSAVDELCLQELGAATGRTDALTQVLPNLEEYLKYLAEGTPFFPPPIPIRPMRNELEAEMGIVRSEMARDYGDIPLTSLDVPDFLTRYKDGSVNKTVTEWLAGKTRFGELDCDDFTVLYCADFFSYLAMPPAFTRILALATMVNVCKGFDERIYAPTVFRIAHEGPAWCRLLAPEDISYLARVSDLWRIAYEKRYSEMNATRETWNHAWRQLNSQVHLPAP